MDFQTGLYNIFISIIELVITSLYCCVLNLRAESLLSYRRANENVLYRITGPRASPRHSDATSLRKMG